MSSEVCSASGGPQTVGGLLISAKNELQIGPKTLTDTMFEHASQILGAPDPYQQPYSIYNLDIVYNDLQHNDENSQQDNILGSSPSGPLYIPTHAPILTVSNDSSSSTTLVRDGSQSSGLSSIETSRSLQRADSINLGELFHVGDFKEKKVNNESKIGLVEIGERSRSCRELPYPKYNGNFCFSVLNCFGGSDQGVISSTKRVVEYAQRKYVISVHEYWKFGQANVGLVYLLFILKDEDVEVDILAQALRSLKFLCEHRELATAFAGSMDGLEILYTLILKSLAQGQGCNGYLGQEQAQWWDQWQGQRYPKITEQLVQVINCIILRASVKRMGGIRAQQMLCKIRKSLFAKELYRCPWECTSSSSMQIHDKTMLEAQKMLQVGLKTQLADVYEGVFPLSWYPNQ